MMTSFEVFSSAPTNPQAAVITKKNRFIPIFKNFSGEATLGIGSRAGSEGFSFHTHALCDVEIEVTERHFLDALGLYFLQLAVTISTSGEHDGQVRVGVGISTPNSTTEQDRS